MSIEDHKSSENQQEPFLVGLRRHDLQHRDDLAGLGQPVGHQRQVRDLQHFLDAHSGVAQGLDDRPGPEGVVLFLSDVGSLTGLDVDDGDLYVFSLRRRPGLVGATGRW